MKNENVISVRESMRLLGKQMKLTRIGLDLSQKDLSEKTGISRSTLSCYESGRWLPPRKHLDKIVVILGKKAFGL